MSPDQVVTQAKQKFDATVERYQEQLKTLRTGRANASMLDGVMAEVYGAPTPLQHVATIAVPEPQLLQITPFDPGNLQAIVSAIRDNQQLGMNPSDDGRVVRVPVPPLNEERRRELVKQLGSRQEDAFVALRNIRHEALDAFDKAKKDKVLGEDDAKRFAAQIEDVMKKAQSEIESATKSKEADIMKV